MPRPKSKVELLHLGKENFEKLIDYIEKFTEEEQLREFPEGTLNRNIRDVLMHLHHWHLMLLGWYKVGMTGKKPIMPAVGYNWKMTPELNQWIRENYKSIDLDEAKKLLQSSFYDVRKIIERHTNDELFEKKRYKWTGSTSMGSYLVSSTSSHYDWALKLIKRVKS